MKRRELMTLLGGAAATWPFAARAQQPTMPVIGFLHSATASGYAPMTTAFGKSLGEAGYFEDQNVATSALPRKPTFDCAALSDAMGQQQTCGNL